MVRHFRLGARASAGLLIAATACVTSSEPVPEVEAPPSQAVPRPTSTSVLLARDEVSEPAHVVDEPSADAESPAPPREIDGMVYIPQGPFTAGRPTNPGASIIIELPGYYIDRLETSVDEYAECVDAGACQVPSGCSRFCTWKKRERTGAHAVNCVAWEDAKAYCAWRGKRLPNELEWEKAARGTDGRLMPWGGDADPDRPPLAEGCKDIHVWTTPRECHAWDKSPYGLMDMAEGVFEWVVGWPHDVLDQRVVDEHEPDAMAFRGGSDRVGRNHWRDMAKRHRSPVDGGWGWTSNKRMSMFDRPGFRCAADAEPR